MTKLIKNPFYISGLFLFFSIIFLTIFFNKISRNSLIEQVEHRQQLSVRLGSELIENLINSVGKSLLFLSNNPNQDQLDQFVETWSSSGIVGITLANKDGIVVKASNTINIPDLGQSLTDRDYFKWAKTSKNSEYRAFTPIISKRGPTNGTYIIPVAVPIFSIDKEFNGVLVIGIPLTNLSNNYLNNIKIIDTSKVYLITSDGVVIFSEDQSLLGKTYKENFNFKFLGKEKIFEILDQNLTKNGESKLKIVLPDLQNNFKLQPFLVSMSPTKVSDQIWKVAVVTPEYDLTTFTFNIFNKQIIAIFIVVMLFISLTLRASRNAGYYEAVKNEHKLHKISQ